MQKGYELTHANKFYFDRSLPLRQCLAERALQGELEAVDMLEKPEKTREQVNRWVKERTRAKITEFLEEGSLAGSKVALVNAAYFKVGVVKNSTFLIPFIRFSQ